QTLGGTSMAAAVVTGASVLLHQAYDALGEHNLTGEASLVHLMQQTGVTIVDNAKGAANVPATGLSFQRLNLLAALNAIGLPAQPPRLAAVANQTMAAGGTLTVPLSATDPNHQAVTFSAAIVSPAATAYQLDQQLGLQYLGSYYTNLEGDGEKWLGSSGGTWYWVLPDGEVRRWQGDVADTLKPAALLATLDSSFYQDPSKLWNAAPAQLPPVSLTVTGSQLTIHATAPYTGTFTVQVTASDSRASAATTFNVTVQAAAPTLAAVANQTVAHGRSLTLSLNGSDADGDVLHYSARIVAPTTGTPATLSVQGNQLTVTAAAGCVGKVTVEATVTDGTLSASQTFTVTVTDAAPVLGTIPAQAMTGSLTLALSATDADGDALSFSAQVLTPDAALYQLNQKLQLRVDNNSYYTNLWGLGDKWLVDPAGQWYFLLPDGSLHRWAGTMSASQQAANTVANIGAAAYAEPRLLWQALPPQSLPVTATVQGSQLTLRATGVVVGAITVQVTVSDGVATA